jgi:CheY-like chemotaxis protein
VLVVDADAARADLVQLGLEQNKYYVETTRDGLEAVRKARSGWFDLVLMGDDIAEIESLAAARLISDFTIVVGRPRLIALTAAPERLRAREAGGRGAFDAILEVPCDMPSLLRTLRDCLAAAPERTYRAAWDTSPAAASATVGRAPHAPPRRSDAPYGDEDPDPSDTVQILVADDELPVLEVLRASLEAQGYDVDTAANGLDALRKLASYRYDIVITDYRMPEIDGLAAAKLMFELHSRSERPRLIAFTATPERLSARDGGPLTLFDEVVAKTRGIDGLLAATRRCADQRRTGATDPLVPIPLIDEQTRTVRPRPR